MSNIKNVVIDQLNDEEIIKLNEQENIRSCYNYTCAYHRHKSVSCWFHPDCNTDEPYIIDVEDYIETAENCNEFEADYVIKPKFKRGDRIRKKNYEQIWIVDKVLDKTYYIRDMFVVNELCFEDQDDYEIVSDDEPSKTDDEQKFIDIEQMVHDYENQVAYDLSGDSDYEKISKIALDYYKQGIIDTMNALKSKNII